MSLDRSWQFVGRVGGLPYRAYDALRRHVNRRLVQFLIKHTVRSTTPDLPVRVLEAGSGTAFASSLLSNHPDIVAAVCLDMDEEALRIARARDGSLLAVIGDLNHLPFRTGAFSLVFSSSTLEHLDDPARVLDDMRRVTETHGHVFVGVPYQFGPLAFEPMIRHSRLGTWIGPVFSRYRLDRLLRSAGLEPIRHTRYLLRVFIGALTRHAAPSARTSGIRAQPINAQTVDRDRHRAGSNVPMALPPREASMIPAPARQTPPNATPPTEAEAAPTAMAQTSPHAREHRP